MHKFFDVAIVSTMVLTLAACSSDSEVRRQQYLDADYYTRLELPPDLTAPDTSRALRVPKPTESAMAHFRQQTASLLPAEEDEVREPAAGGKVATKVPGIDLKTDGSGSWLLVNLPADRLWPLLQDFWRNEGIVLKRSQQVLGLMETDWVSKLQVSEDAGFFEKMFSNFEPERVDRFTLQLQRTGNGKQTRITVTHAGMEIQVEEDGSSGYHSREREPALEMEILKRLALFLGQQQALIDPVLLQDYMPFASRVKTTDYHPNSLEVIGDKAYALSRLDTALKAMKVVIAEKDAAAGRVRIQFEQLAPELRGEERDEFTEASWIMNLFKDDASGEGKGFTLQLTELEHTTRIDILRESDEPDDSVLAEQLSASLLQQLR